MSCEVVMVNWWLFYIEILDQRNFLHLACGQLLLTDWLCFFLYRRWRWMQILLLTEWKRTTLYWSHWSGKLWPIVVKVSCCLRCLRHLLSFVLFRFQLRLDSQDIGNSLVIADDANFHLSLRAAAHLSNTHIFISFNYRTFLLPWGFGVLGFWGFGYFFQNSFAIL